VGSILIRRVVLRNYKSISACDLRLGALMFLVGPNGAGKSNFLDALRLVADGLRSPLDHALRERGGIDDVRRRSTGHPHNFTIRLELDLPRESKRALFAFEVAAKSSGAFEIKREKCSIDTGLPLFDDRDVPERSAAYEVERGTVVECSIDHPPAAAADRLFLVNLSGVPAFRPLYDALSRMAFYNLSPAEMREVQPPDAGRLLARDGSNVAGVLGRLEVDAPEAVERVKEYLARISPGVRDVTREQVANKETLLFRQEVKGAKNPWKFFANSMSDGTLRALGVLLALAQGSDPTLPVPLIAIEEPEAALHPGAALILFEALRDASEQSQVLVTSHSPDLLDNEDVIDDQLVAVAFDEGVTTIGPLGEADRGTLRDRLFTAGELLRMAPLEPDQTAVENASEQMDLFAPLDS
jgi:predicted ATPase